MICLNWKRYRILLFALLLASSSTLALNVTFTDVNPDQSSRDAIAAWGGASGGRINGLAIDPSDPATAYAASEWGGIYKTVDGALSWRHLPGHTAMTTWDVEVDPTNGQRIFATSFFDGRTASRASLNISADGGSNWERPQKFVPPPTFCDLAAAQNELSAYGIAIDPDAPQNVYVGTNCGLAHSPDGGINWTFIDPAPARAGARAVWDVVVHNNGIVDVCGFDGHRRRQSVGSAWSNVTAAGLMTSVNRYCSIAVSPDEPGTLIIVAGTTIYESNDGGASWPHTYANCVPQGRIPFVEFNKRSGAAFDLWFGDVTAFRAACATPTTPTTARRCTPSVCTPSINWVNVAANAHNDAGVIIFDPTVRTDACPMLYSNDGGVYYNTIKQSPGCHTPNWEQPNVTPHGLWLWDLDGADLPGSNQELLYLAAQDNGAFVSADAGAVSPTWLNPRSRDIFDIQATDNHVVTTMRDPREFAVADLDLQNSTVITNLPGRFVDFRFLKSLDHFGADRLVVVTDNGVYFTEDIGSSPVKWSSLGAATTPAGACAVQASVRADKPTFIVKSGGCNGDIAAGLWRFEGLAGGKWEQIQRNGVSAFGVYAVDPHRPGRILASDLAGGSVTMVLTENAGLTWTVLSQLDALMTGNGSFVARTQLSPRYVQPTLVAFDPDDPEVAVAGGYDSGVFLSTDAGYSWQLVSDPLTSDQTGIPHLPRPRHAYFDHEISRGDVSVFVGTQGRGVWRLNFSKPTISAVQGRVAFLRVHPPGSGWGVVPDRLDGEVIVRLENSPELTFDLELPVNPDGPAGSAMFAQLRQAFKDDYPVRIEYRKTGLRIGRILRVIDARN